MNRVLLRPSGQDEDVYNFILAVPILIMTRFQPVAKNSPIFFIHLLREQTYSLETSFGCRSTGQSDLCYFFARDDDPYTLKTKHPYG